MIYEPFWNSNETYKVLKRFLQFLTLGFYCHYVIFGVSGHIYSLRNHGPMTVTTVKNVKLILIVSSTREYWRKYYIINSYVYRFSVFIFVDKTSACRSVSDGIGFPKYLLITRMIGQIIQIGGFSQINSVSQKQPNRQPE